MSNKFVGYIKKVSSNGVFFTFFEDCIPFCTNKANKLFGRNILNVFSFRLVSRIRNIWIVCFMPWRPFARIWMRILFLIYPHLWFGKTRLYYGNMSPLPDKLIVQSVWGYGTAELKSNA